MKTLRIVPAALIVAAAAMVAPGPARADTWPPVPPPLPAGCPVAGAAAPSSGPAPHAGDPCRPYRISVGTVATSALMRTDALRAARPGIHRTSVGTVSLSALERKDSLYPHGRPPQPMPAAVDVGEPAHGAEDAGSFGASAAPAAPAAPAVVASSAPAGYYPVVVPHGNQTERYIVPLETEQEP